jgi:retron-type reverse transcriptase
MEQLVHHQIKLFLENSNFFAKHQYGFTNGKSTTLALASLLDEILIYMDKGYLTITLFLDFKKAFDTVDHKILLQKLALTGLSDATCNLMANYLINRTQATRLRGVGTTTK